NITATVGDLGDGVEVAGRNGEGKLAAAQRIAEPVLHTCQPRRLKRDLSYRCRSPLCGVANGRGIADDLRDDCYRARLCRLTVAAVTNALPRVHREVGADDIPARGVVVAL